MPWPSLGSLTSLATADRPLDRLEHVPHKADVLEAIKRTVGRAHRVFAFWLPVIPGSIFALTLPRIGRQLATVGELRHEATVEEHRQAFDWLDAPIERVGAKFAPLPFAPVMEEFVVPHKADVLEAIKRTVGRG